MTTQPAVIPAPASLTTAQFHTLAEIPPELEWFANLPNPNTRRAYRQDLDDFMAFAGPHRPEQFREVTRAQAWPRPPFPQWGVKPARLNSLGELLLVPIANA
jgi:hypothetical protein